MVISSTSTHGNGPAQPFPWADWSEASLVVLDLGYEDLSMGRRKKEGGIEDGIKRDNLKKEIFRNFHLFLTLDDLISSYRTTAAKVLLSLSLVVLESLSVFRIQVPDLKVFVCFP